jgi:hypothetical protein
MNGSVRSSAGLVWRHQRLVWWIFAVNLVLAWLGSLSTRAVFSSVLDHSLESAKLVTGFDISTMVLMLSRPDVSMRAMAPSAIGASVVFVIYLLFIDGGVFAVFLDDRKLSRAEFFECAGLFFWRMVRLALYSLVPFALLAVAHSLSNKYAGKLADNAPQDRLGFFVNVASMLIVLLLALFVRMCFDLAQAQVVRDNERKVLGILGRSIKLAIRSGKLYTSYVGIGIFAVVTFGVGIGIWVYLPHSATGASFVALELVTVTQIASRLWMKAESARWVALLPEEVAIPKAVAPLTEVVTSAPEITDMTPPTPEPPYSE